MPNSEAMEIVTNQATSQRVWKSRSHNLVQLPYLRKSRAMQHGDNCIATTLGCRRRQSHALARQESRNFGPSAYNNIYQKIFTLQIELFWSEIRTILCKEACCSFWIRRYFFITKKHVKKLPKKESSFYQPTRIY